MGNECSTLQSDLAATREELATAQGDAKRYSEQAAETQAVYERELMNHGKSMQALCDLREQVGVSSSWEPRGSLQYSVYLCMWARTFTLTFCSEGARTFTLTFCSEGARTFTLTFCSEGWDREIMVDLVVGQNAHDAYCTLVDTRWLVLSGLFRSFVRTDVENALTLKTFSIWTYKSLLLNGCGQDRRMAKPDFL